MIDYWEAIGRLAYDEDLVDELKTKLPQPGSIGWVTLTATNGGATSTCLNIPEPKYKEVQDLLAPVLAEQYLSLFAAGELIWTFDNAKSRDLFDQIVKVVAETEPKLHSPSASYFIALGLVLVDSGFRKDVQECVQTLPRLSAKQRDHIRNLVHCPHFPELAEQFDDIPWEEGCFVSDTARLAYRHPFALDATKATESKTAGATSWATTPS